MKQTNTLPYLYCPFVGVEGYDYLGNLSPRVQNLSNIFPGKIFVNGILHNVVPLEESIVHIDSLLEQVNAEYTSGDLVSIPGHIFLYGTLVEIDESGVVNLTEQPGYSALLKACEPYQYSGPYTDLSINDDLSD